jgi:hypothetical protein
MGNILFLMGNFIYRYMLKYLKITINLWTKDRACYAVENGEKLDIWNDPWIPSVSRFNPTAN